MSANTQLLLTHGTTDLQILLEDESGHLWRAVPDKSIVRAFHETLLSYENEAKIVALNSELQSRDAEVAFTDWQDDTFALWTGDENLNARPLRDSSGRLQLVLPKIEPTLKQWLADSARSDNSVATGISRPATDMRGAGIHHAPLASVLVLSTDRGTDLQEPVATFTLLKQWLMAIGVPGSSIRECVFLHPGEKLENDDSPVAPAIAQRIESAVTSFYNRAAASTLLVASMGGLPQIKSLLAELAVLLAGNKAQNLFKTELGALGLLQRTPLDALRVRRQCLERVRCGALLDAWTMAAPFHSDPDARVWVRPLEEAARLLNGNPAGERASLPALQRILDNADKAACLLVAIRVETALQNERWLEAVNGSLTFLEAALHDAINAWAATHLADYQPRRRLMKFHTAPVRQLIDSGALKSWEGREAGPLTYQANLVGEKAMDAWFQLLRNIPLGNLRQAFYQKVKLNLDGAFRPVEYRNYNTHGVMTQNEIDEAIQCFIGTNLWSQGIDNPSSRPLPGNGFLSGHLVQGVIGHFLGQETYASALYQELLQQLEARLIDPTTALS